MKNSRKGKLPVLPLLAAILISFSFFIINSSSAKADCNTECDTGLPPDEYDACVANCEYIACVDALDCGCAITTCVGSSCGADCDGSGSGDCAGTKAKVNGGWSAEWNGCSVTGGLACGAGIQYKYCNNPTPACGGSDCNPTGGSMTQSCTASCTAGNNCCSGSCISTTSDTTCDNVDDDCDGTADDNYAGVACGSGGCVGTTSCSVGSTVCSTSGTDCGTCCKCSSDGTPNADNSQDTGAGTDCPETNCVNACGAGGCSANIWGTYAVSSVNNACTGLNTCENKGCPAASCAEDGDADTYAGGAAGTACYDCNDDNDGINPSCSDATCNNVDEDCDGTADDGYASVACGSGACEGTTSCSGGVVSCSKSGTDCGTCCTCSTGMNPAVTYDAGQDADCAATTCAADGYGAGGCGPGIWGDNPGSVANECGGVGSCTSKPCVADCTTDFDGDGYSGPGDCQDGNPLVNPGAPDTNCNGVDEDCDGTADDGYASVNCGSGNCALNVDGTTAATTKCVNVAGVATVLCSSSGKDCGTCCTCSTGANSAEEYNEAQDALPYTASVYDNKDCAPTLCPADVCGNDAPEGCKATQLADYPPNVPNTCEALRACTSTPCYATCQSGADADGIHPKCGPGGGDCYDADETVYPGSCMVNAVAWGDPPVTFPPPAYPFTGEACPARVAATPAVPNPPNNPNNCLCDESTKGGCDYQTCTRDTDGVLCDNEINVCTLGENRYCNVDASAFPDIEDIWADTGTDKNCDAVCSGTLEETDADCDPGCTPADCDTAVIEECQRCDGELSISPFTPDTPQDFSPCTEGQTACPYTPYPDTCADSTILNEYYCGGVDYAMQQVNCNLYDGSCDGACGSAIDGCKGRDYGCSTSACTYTPIDADEGSFWCAGCMLQWLKGGETEPTAFGEYSQGDSTACCGDDKQENIRFRDCAADTDPSTMNYNIPCNDDETDRACCNKETDCVFKGKCYNDIGSVVSLVQTDPEAVSFCGTKHNQNACIGGTKKEKYMCKWTGISCVVAPTTAGVFVSQLELGDKALYPAYADIDANGQWEVCKAASPGKWEGAEGSIHGYVRNISTTNCLGKCVPADCSKGCPVSGAAVRILGTSPPLQVKTDSDGGNDGEYWVPNAPVGALDIVAAGTGYDAKVLPNIFVPDGTKVELDFTLVQTLGGCEDDCTLLGSNACDVSCHGKGMCWFYSDETKSICQDTFGIVEIPAGYPDAGKYVNCCKGKPYMPVKATVDVLAKDVVTIKRAVNRLGQIMNIVITVFRPGAG